MEYVQWMWSSYVCVLCGRFSVIAVPCVQCVACIFDVLYTHVDDLECHSTIQILYFWSCFFKTAWTITLYWKLTYSGWDQSHFVKSWLRMEWINQLRQRTGLHCDRSACISNSCFQLTINSCFHFFFHFHFRNKTLSELMWLYVSGSMRLSLHRGFHKSRD